MRNYFADTRLAPAIAASLCTVGLTCLTPALAQERVRPQRQPDPVGTLQATVQSIEVAPLERWGIRPEPDGKRQPQRVAVGTTRLQAQDGLNPTQSAAQLDLYSGLSLSGFYWWWTNNAYWGLDDGAMAIPNARAHVNEIEFVFGLHADFPNDMLQPQAILQFWSAPADPVGGAAGTVVNPALPEGAILVTFNPVTLPAAGDFLLTSGALPLPPSLQFDLDRTFYVELVLGEVQSGFFDPDVFAVFGQGPPTLGANQDRMWNDQFFFRDTPGNCSAISFGDADGFYEHPAELDVGQCPLDYRGQSPVRLAGTPLAELSLQVAPGCLADGVGPESPLLTVELWMQNLPEPATGFQAFLDFDDALLTFRDDLSTYTGTPFGSHIQAMSVAEVAPGELNLDGSVNTSGQPGTDQDNLLATLVFEVQSGVECVTTDFGFRTFGPFSSEFSNAGVPLLSNTLGVSSIYLDNTPPEITSCPSPITQNADAGLCTADVTWPAATATDNCSTPSIVYDIDVNDDSVVDATQPGTAYTFPTGTHRVTVRATDDCGLETTCDFIVTIDALNTLLATVELSGVGTPGTRCLRFIPLPGGCASGTVDVLVNFTDHDTNPATAVRAVNVAIDIPCGAWTSVCVKDEQHTLYSTGTISDLGTQYQTDAVIVLSSGDTDNDSDVDINDVTWLIAQFGLADNPGGCPWDGVTRDADFSNDGNVGSEDYTLLTASFLTLTDCTCVLPLHRGAQPFAEPADVAWAEDFPADVAEAADLNQDGLIDVDDVVLFEQLHGLPTALSDRMKQLSGESAGSPVRP